MHNRNNRFNFLWEKMFFLRKNIFVVPAIQVRTAVKTFRNAYCIILEKKPEKSYSMLFVILK